MTARPVGAVTFDLWDTVFLDDSDEPKRKAQGLPPKKVERRSLVERFLATSGPAVTREAVDRAYDAVDEVTRKTWHDEYVTLTVTQRLNKILAALGRELPPEKFAELVRAHEEMELRISPDLIPGAVDAVKALRGTRKLVVISDAIFTPGWGLRKLLEAAGILDAFTGFVFSDEFGKSKPASEVFHRAAAIAGCRVEELVHVGDREHNDVGGPHAVGARAVFVTAGLDRGSATTKAERICRDFRDLPGIIDSMDEGGH